MDTEEETAMWRWRKRSEWCSTSQRTPGAPETGRGKRAFSPRIFSEHNPATTLIVDFWSLALGEINFCRFQLNVSRNLLWQPRK